MFAGEEVEMMIIHQLMKYRKEDANNSYNKGAIDALNKLLKDVQFAMENDEYED